MSQKSSPTDKLKSAVGKEDKSNKHITKITAKSASQNSDVASRPEATGDAESQDRHITNIKAGSASKATKTASDAKSDKKNLKKSSKSDRSEKPLKEVFILARPFVALGRYIRDSWRELRQVRWPNRKATWKMTLAVLVYCAILMVFILLLDTLFTFLFNLILKS